METIIINVEDKSKAKLVLNAVKLFNGVTRAVLIKNNKKTENPVLDDIKESLREIKAGKQKPIESLFK